MEKQTEYGALWIKSGPKGEYMTGNLSIGEQKIKVVAFKNTQKKNPNEPDWRILESKPLTPTNTTETPIIANSSVPEAPEYPEEDINPDDIPF